MSSYVVIERDGTVVIKAKRSSRTRQFMPFTKKEERDIRNRLVRIIDQRPMSRLATSSCHQIVAKMLKLNKEVVALRRQFLKIKKEHDAKDNQLELLQAKLANATCGMKNTPVPR